MMVYLSHAVNSPLSDVKARRVEGPYLANGTLRDLSALTAGMITIYSSNTEPDDTFVKVYTYGHWFYIRASDSDSKITFSLLIRLLTLMGGMSTSQAQQGPILTLPVAAA